MFVHVPAARKRFKNTLRVVPPPRRPAQERDESHPCNPE